MGPKLSYDYTSKTLIVTKFETTHICTKNFKTSKLQNFEHSRATVIVDC